MALHDDLVKEVTGIFAAQWTNEKATVIPEPKNLLLNSNHAKELESATVLYADIDGSTSMVDSKTWGFAAEVYKAYLRCASQILRNEGGSIAAYDGDRVMAVFYGGAANTSAVRAALKINSAALNIINPAIKAQYPTANFALKHVVGIDTSQLHVARVGVHADNDLVWVGRAANYAAKLCASKGAPTWITAAVYNAMNDQTKISTEGVNMWQATAWGTLQVYYSTFQWNSI